MKTVYTSGQLAKFTTLGGDKGVTSEHFQIGLGNGIFADVADFLVSGNSFNREAVRKALGLGPSKLITVVDYGLTVKQMIAVGQYDWANSDITQERFPVVGEGKVEYENKIFHFGKNVSSEEAVRRIKAEDTENPWTPWVTEETLAFGATYPEEQRKFWIVGLGSSCEVYSNRNVLVLNEDGSKRRLNLNYWGGGWSGDYRFGAARRLFT